MRFKWIFAVAGVALLSALLVQVGPAQQGKGKQATKAATRQNSIPPGDWPLYSRDLASDRFIAFSTWRWAELHAKTNSPVYRYYFTRPRPALRADMGRTTAVTPVAPGGFHGAVHSAEIEYAMGNLPTNRVYDWQPDDYLVSAIMQDYFLNFIKTKNPNGLGLPDWPLYQVWQKDPIQYIGVETGRHADSNRERYLYLEKTALP